MIRPVGTDGRLETGGAFTPVVRPRVVERIAVAAAARIALIIAPAGYGKSVALRQYLDSLEETYVRYDVQAEHSSLLGFVRGLADALADAAPDARKSVSTAYEKSRSSKTPGADLALWMHAHIKTFTGLIAIDDLHAAEDDPEVSKFLIPLIERTKGRVNWIIASRSSLDLPVGSWLAYGEMDLNVDEQDLRFTIEEARQTAKAVRVGVRDEELSEILGMTEGWPTAMSFALRTSTRSVDLRNITATTREMVYKYLAEQVYRSLTSAERDLVQFVSYLPTIEIELLRFAGFANGKAAIETLRERVAFIYADRPGVYRCHDLFRDFLRHQVELEGDAAVESLRERAARALESNGNIPAALDLFSQAKKDADILRLLEGHGFALREQARADCVQRAIDTLPADMRASNALILGLRACGETEQGRYDRAESLFGRAIARAESRTLAADLSIRLALVLFNQGRDVAPLLEPVANEDLPEALHASAVALLAMGHAYAGRMEASRRAMEIAEELVVRVESDELRAKMYLRIANSAFELKLPQDRVAAYYTRAQALAQETALFTIASHALGGLANVSLFYEDDASKCAWYAQQALNAAGKAGERLPAQTALLQLINVELRRGNSERMQALLTQFAATATTTDPVRMSYVMPVRAMSAAWEGRFEEAHRIFSLSDPAFYNFDRICNTAELAVYAIASGRRERALELAGKALSEVEQGEFEYLFGRRQVEMARYLCACVEIFAGRLTNANRILQRRSNVEGAAVEAMREAALAIWRAAKRPALRDEVIDAIEQLRTVGAGGLGRVLEQAFSACIEAEPAHDGQVQLTKTELHVLSQLARGLSPKDIADETGRSVYTIQAHVQNVIKKLGCSGRQEALTLARKRGLLEN